MAKKKIVPKASPAAAAAQPPAPAPPPPVPRRTIAELFSPADADRRPIVILKTAEKLRYEEMVVQQEVANQHAAPFGLRVMIIPHDLDFAGVVHA